jgi:hypothetical protein
MRNFLTGLPALTLAASLLTGPGSASSADQCLPASELGNIGRMASVMAMGVAVQRCGRCLGAEQYTELVQVYQKMNLMRDFSEAHDSLNLPYDKFTYADEQMRDFARKLAADLSADCSACEKTATTLEGLTSESARSAFYKSETDALSKAPETKLCR